MVTPMTFSYRGTDRYHVVRKLGSGGMGVVFEVVDQEREHRIALKTHKYLDSESLYRFKKEFRSLQNLAHKNLVVLYDLVVENHVCFYTMELVDGVDFATYCARGRPQTNHRFDEYRLRSGLSQLAKGIRVLHAAGKVHRDIKPSNVLVDAKGRVVILDFGLVAAAADEADQTQTMSDGGTAFYMAPEQVGGDTGVTRAADMYSVGVVLYEVLTGKLPTEGNPEAIWGKKKYTDPISPSKLNPAVPEDLEQ